jgi:glycosyltransferase involved in cell wall biosynthesis
MEHTKVLMEEKDQMQRDTSPDKSVELSVVVPISEHHDDLRQIYFEYAKELSADGHSYEFIFVLDGPRQNAHAMLKELKKEYPEIIIVMLNRRFGEAAALSVGFIKARGSVILTLAPYFQVVPHEVHKMLKKLSEDGNDLVISRRYPRIDSLFNQAQSWVFHRLTRMLTGMKYHDISCGLRAMKRRVAEETQLYGDLHRFIPLLAHQRGFKVAEIPVQQSPGDVKSRVFKPGVYLRRLLDILTLFFLFKFTQKPLRFFGLIGSGIFGIGAIITAYLGFYRLLGLGPIAGRPLLILGVLLIVLGVQLFSIGFLGEIIIFTHARKIKEYTIDKVIK